MTLRRVQTSNTADKFSLRYLATSHGGVGRGAGYSGARAVSATPIRSVLVLLDLIEFLRPG